MSSSRNRPLIIAHRGASHEAPENTIGAFELALSEGSEGVEMDVVVAGDGVPVVFHDASLRRMTGQDLKIAALDHTALSRVSVGEWFNRRYPGRARDAYQPYGIPTLAEALERLEGFRGPVYVELKCRAADLHRNIPSVARVFSGSSVFSRIIFKCFVPDAVLLIREACPGLQTAALFAPKVMAIIRREERLVSIAQDLGANALSLHSALATKKLVKKAHRAGLGVTVWTIDNPRWMKRAIELGIDAIITNRPAKMLLKRRELLHRNSITA